MAESPSTSSYPTIIDSWNFLTDKEDLAEVSDINKLKNAVLDVQTELGVAPSGSLATVTARLAMIQNVDGAIQKGTSFPVSGLVEGQMFYRTDLNVLYVYDGVDWDNPGGIAFYADGTVTEISFPPDAGVTTQASYTKVYELSPLIRSGTISVSWQQKVDGAGGLAKGKVYLSGVATGVEKQVATGGAYEVLTDTGIDVSSGDSIQIYAYCYNGAASTSVKDVKILCSNPITCHRVTP